MSGIQGVSQLRGLPPMAPLQPQAEAAGPSFKDYLLDSIQQVNDMQQHANHAVETLATGGDIDQAEVLTAVQKADISFRMLMQIRNKLVSAYDEVKSMRV